MKTYPGATSIPPGNRGCPVVSPDDSGTLLPVPGGVLICLPARINMTMLGKGHGPEFGNGIEVSVRGGGGGGDLGWRRWFRMTLKRRSSINGNSCPWVVLESGDDLGEIGKEVVDDWLFIDGWNRGIDNGETSSGKSISSAPESDVA